MRIRLIIAYLLNLFDLGMTCYFAYNYGIGIEGNPIGRFLLENPLALFVVKVIIIGALFILLYKFRERRLARIGSWVTFGAYTLLSVYHIILFLIIRI